jgi:hypothetical protein
VNILLIYPSVRSSHKAVAVCAALNLGFKRGIKNVGRLAEPGGAVQDVQDGVKSTQCQFSEHPGEGSRVRG